MPHLPLFLNLKENDDILVVGGGSIAAAKLESLRAHFPKVRVVAKDISPAVQAFIDQHQLPYALESYQTGHLKGARVVIAATNDNALNEWIASEARVRGILVNVVDNASLCDFIFPALVQRGDIQIAISSSALSPVLARLIKQKIERILPWNLEKLGHFIRDRRQAVSAALPNLQSRRLFWQSVIDGPVAQEVLEHNPAKAEQLFNRALDIFPRENRAALYLIGAGPGHPDFITVRGSQLLAEADIVLYDRLVSPELLDRYARRDAEKIAVGKERGRHSLSQSEIDNLIAQLLSEGKIVARLKGGDSGIYAHAAEELIIAKELGVPYQIVPGITAASGCAATAGIPLTERGGARSVRLLTLYDNDTTDEHFWANIAADKQETLVFYMSTSHRKTLCQKLIENGFPADTPILAVEQGTTPQHREYAATLQTFPEFYGDYPFLSPTLFIVGNVVRWREEFQWREPATDHKPYFTQRDGDRSVIS